MVALAVVSVAALAVLGYTLRIVLAENRRLTAAIALDRGAPAAVVRVLAEPKPPREPADREPRTEVIGL